MRAEGRGFQAHAETIRDGRLEGGARLVGIERECATDEMAGVEEAEDDIGISQRRHRAARVVAYRSGRRARALWAHLQCATAVDPYVRSAAGTDLGQVDGWHFQSVAGARQQSRAGHDAGTDRVFLGAHHLAILDHRGLGRGATHIEGDDLVETGRLRQRLGPDDTAGWTRT